MNIYTSYFYQIRFFPKNLVPLSTALSDPKWFHDNKSRTHQFKDKRGVLNGIRAEIFNPEMQEGGDCHGPQGCQWINRPLCPFKANYLAQLNKLDFNVVMDRFNHLAAIIKEKEGFDTVDFALIVHEAPTNPCSERSGLQYWFNSHGIQVREWSRDLI